MKVYDAAIVVVLEKEAMLVCASVSYQKEEERIQEYGILKTAIF